MKFNNLLLNKRVVVFDIETTGLNKTLDTIIELGAIEFINGEETRQYNKLFGGGRSPVFLVKNVHGIKDSDRIGKPTFKECADEIVEFLSNALLVGHNIKNFDLPMIQIKLQEVDKQLSNVQIIDTLQLCRKSKRFESNKLSSLCDVLDIPYGNHRGLSDAYSTIELLNTIIPLLQIEKI